MKRGIAEHPKTKRLARRLGIPIPYAVGLVEMLCNQWAPRVAIQGDIGKWPDEDIADGLGYPGDPEQLVEALVGSGWVDRHPTHRLVIHDWHDHADQGVRNRLKTAGLTFVSAAPTPGPTGGATAAAPASDGGSDPPSDGGSDGGSPGPGKGTGKAAATAQATAGEAEAAATRARDGWKRQHGVQEWDWPFVEVWIERFEMPPDRVADFCAGLDPIRGIRPREDAVARFRRYLDPALNRDKPQFLHPRKFVATYGAWTDDVPRSADPRGLDAVRSVAADWEREGRLVT